VTSRFHTPSAAISLAIAAGIGPYPTSSPGCSAAPMRVSYGITTCTSGLPGLTGSGTGTRPEPVPPESEPSGAATVSRPVSSAVSRSARRASIPRGSSAPIPRASRVNHS
jgi:hypothetical protein